LEIAFAPFPQLRRLYKQNWALPKADDRGEFWTYTESSSFRWIVGLKASRDGSNAIPKSRDLPRSLRPLMPRAQHGGAFCGQLAEDRQGCTARRSSEDLPMHAAILVTRATDRMTDVQQQLSDRITA
jgi:hypothetical protein